MVTFSSGAYVSNKLPESYLKLIRKFTKYNEDLRWYNNFELSQKTNMDETILFINFPNTKMIVKIGTKGFKIKTHGQERIHVTVILWIVADGTKLPQR